MDSSPSKTKLRAKLANKNKFSKLSLKSRKQQGNNKENNHPVRSIKKSSFDSDLITSDESENSFTKFENHPLRSSIVSNIQEPTSSLPIAESTRYEVLSVNPRDVLESSHLVQNSSSSSGLEYYSACPLVGCDESIVCLSDSYSDSEERVSSTKTRKKMGNDVKSESLIISSDDGESSPTKAYSYQKLNGQRKGKDKKLCDTVIILDSSDEETSRNQGQERGCNLVIPCSPRSTSDVSSSSKRYSSTEEPIKGYGLVIPPSPREDTECLSTGSIISEDNTSRKFGKNSKDFQDRKSSFGSFVCSSVVDMPFSNQRKANCKEITTFGKESLLVEANQSSWQEDSRLVNPEPQESNCEKDEVSPTMPGKLSSEEAAGSLSKQKYKDIARWLFSGEESLNSSQTVDKNVEKDPLYSDLKYPQKNKVPIVRRSSSGSESDDIVNPSLESTKRRQDRKPKKEELDSFIVDSDASDVAESPSFSMYHADLTRSIKAEVKSAKKEAKYFGVRKNLYHSNASDSELSDTNSIISSQIKGTSPFKSLRKPNRLISSSDDSDSDQNFKRSEKKWTFQDERDLQNTQGKGKGHSKKVGESEVSKKKVGSIDKGGPGSRNCDSPLDEPSKQKLSKQNDATWRQCDVSSEGSSSDSAKFQYPVPKSLIPKTSRKKKPTQPKPDCKRTPPMTPKRIAALKSPGTPYSPIRTFLSSLSGPTHQPGVRDHPEAAVYNKNFKTKKEELTRRLFKLFNREIFDSKLPQDMIVEWKPRLIRTAGLCYCKLLRQNGVTTRSAKIALSSKVNTSPDRLRDTLIHEMCHAAVWLLNNVSGGHGPFWKAWASKAMKRFPELPAIQRCHSYKIETKFTYRCTQCGYSFGRHSKSLDLNRKRCGYCYGTFEVLVSGKTQSDAEKVLKTPKAPSAFALFVKENYGLTKQENGGMKHGDIMKKLGEKFSTMKIQNP